MSDDWKLNCAFPNAVYEDEDVDDSMTETPSALFDPNVQESLAAAFGDPEVLLDLRCSRKGCGQKVGQAYSGSTGQLLALQRPATEGDEVLRDLLHTKRRKEEGAYQDRINRVHYRIDMSGKAEVMAPSKERSAVVTAACLCSGTEVLVVPIPDVERLIRIALQIGKRQSLKLRAAK